MNLKLRLFGLGLILWFNCKIAGAQNKLLTLGNVTSDTIRVSELRSCDSLIAYTPGKVGGFNFCAGIKDKDTGVVKYTCIGSDKNNISPKIKAFIEYKAAEFEEIRIEDASITPPGGKRFYITLSYKVVH